MATAGTIDFLTICGLPVAANRKFVASFHRNDNPLTREVGPTIYKPNRQYPQQVSTTPKDATFPVHIEITNTSDFDDFTNFVEEQENLSKELSPGTTGDLWVSFSNVGHADSETRRMKVTVKKLIPFDGSPNRATVILYAPDPRWRGQVFPWEMSVFPLTGGGTNDKTRDTNTEGDGRTVDGSTGLYRAATNKVTNGGFTTNTTGWSKTGTNTIARSTDQAKFGSASLLCTYGNNTRLAFDAVTLTAAKYTLSAWIYIPAGWDGGAVEIKTYQLASVTETVIQSAAAAVTGKWQKVITTITPDAGDLAGYVMIQTDSAPTAGKTLYVDGVQAELGDCATPYVETDGGEATRAASSQAIATVDADPNEGYFAAKVRLAWDDDTIDGDKYLFQWRVDASNLLQLYYDQSSSAWKGTRLNGGAGLEVQALDAIAIDQEVIVIFAWSATQLSISVDGAGSVSYTHLTLPTNREV